jgi:hypothetical protein
MAGDGDHGFAGRALDAAMMQLVIAVIIAGVLCPRPRVGRAPRT